MKNTRAVDPRTHAVSPALMCTRGTLSRAVTIVRGFGTFAEPDPDELENSVGDPLRIYHLVQMLTTKPLDDPAQRPRPGSLLVVGSRELQIGAGDCGPRVRYRQRLLVVVDRQPRLVGDDDFAYGRVRQQRDDLLSGPPVGPARQ